MASSATSGGQTVIITGGNIGLGYQCAKAIAEAKKDWHIVITCRSKEKCHQATQQLINETGYQNISGMVLELSALESVRKFAKDFSLKELPPLHAIVCNAGIQIVDGTSYTKDGFEMTFGVNHLSHFLLVNLLLKYLANPGRIIFVSSGTHDPAQKTGMPNPRLTEAQNLAWPDKDANPPKDTTANIGRLRYTTSKLCNVWCAYELAKRLQKEGHSPSARPIDVNAFDPGLMPGTGLARSYKSWQRFAWKFILPALRLFMRNTNSTAKSGKALARLVLDPQLQGVTAKYFEGLKEIPSSKDSYDEQQAEHLWKESVKMVKLKKDEAILRI